MSEASNLRDCNVDLIYLLKGYYHNYEVASTIRNEKLVIMKT